MQELFVRTDKKLIPTLPRYTFNGRIVVVQSESEANRAIDYLRKHSIVGIDTETRPSFRRGVQYKVALIQIATSEICFLFRLNYMENRKSWFVTQRRHTPIGTKILSFQTQELH